MTDGVNLLLDVLEQTKAKTYHIWLSDTPKDKPLVITVCASCYDGLSFIHLIESQVIVAENQPCHNSLNHFDNLSNSIDREQYHPEFRL